MPKQSNKLDEDKIVLRAVFQSAKTTVDGGLRISFDVDGSQAECLTRILQLKENVLFVVIAPVDE